MPKVSVIIPVYNVEKYLRECLGSVINQTFWDIEIICVNDGSTDNSLEILNEYAKNDERVIVINQQNLGAGVARNSGLKIAKGEYLAFLDGDDFYRPDYIEKMYNQAKKTNADITICSADYYDMQTKKYKYMRVSIFEPYLPAKEVFNYNDMPNYIFNFAQNWNWNKLFNHEFVKKNCISFQNLYRTNDLYFTCCALSLAQRITTVKEPLVVYRVGLSENSQSTNYKYPFDFYEAFKQLRLFLLDKNLYDTVKQSYINWAIVGVMHNYQSINDKKIKERLRHLICTSGLKELDLKSINENNVYNLDLYKYFVEMRAEDKANCYKPFVIAKGAYHIIISVFGLKIKIKL